MRPADDHSGIPKRAQILRGVKAEARNVAERSGPFSVVKRAMALRAIFDQPQAVGPRDLGERGQIGRLAVDMHGQHRRRPAG